MFVYINIKAKQIKQMKKGTSVTSILMFFFVDASLCLSLDHGH